MAHNPFKTSTRVYLRASPENQGTVTAVTSTTFTVSWDNHHSHTSRRKFTYKWAQAPLFKVGNPPRQTGESRETVNG